MSFLPDAAHSDAAGSDLGALDQGGESRADRGPSDTLRPDALVDAPPAQDRRVERASDVDRAPDLPPPPADKDGDKVPDGIDNCPTVANPSQADLDKDGKGDACDDDIDGDTLPNDVDPDATKANVVYYYKTADQLKQDGDLNGSWSTSGTKLCQWNWNDTFSVILDPKFVPSSNYLVETKVTVVGIDPSLPAGWWPSPTLLYRVGPVDSDYDCSANLGDYRLEIGKWDGTTWSSLANGTNGSLPKNGPYRLRAIVKGSSLTCQLGGTPLSVSKMDPDFPTGTVGFLTDHVRACFEYLLVVAAP